MKPLYLILLIFLAGCASAPKCSDIKIKIRDAGEDFVIYWDYEKFKCEVGNSGQDERMHIIYCEPIK